MAATIGKNDPIGQAVQAEKRTVVAPPESRQRADRAQGAQQEEAAPLEVSQQSGSRGVQLVQLNDVASALSIASEAVSKVTGLRERQLEIAKEAEGSGDPARREELDGEFQAIEKEIRTVVEDATFGDEDALGDRTIEVSADSFGIEERIEVSGARAATEPLEASLRSREEARDATKELGGRIEALGAASEGLESSLRKASGALETASRQSSTAPSTGEGASELVSRLAGDIKSPPRSDQSSRDIVASVTNNLSPQRVNELLRV